jgi:hypothetical protein
MSPLFVGPRRSLSSGRIRATRCLAMTAFAHCASIYQFESSRRTAVGVGLADRGRRLWATSPHRRLCMESWPQAVNLENAALFQEDHASWHLGRAVAVRRGRIPREVCRGQAASSVLQGHPGGRLMKLTHKFAEMTPDKRPQEPHLDGTGLGFETMEHGGE